MVCDPVANFAAVSATTHTHDVIIIGTGLAGRVLSETLALQGLRVLVFDVAQKGSASNVAAGMVNPIVLRRTVPSWRAGEMLAIAGAFYRDLEMRYDTTLWYPFSMAALFPTAQEAGIWQRRLKDPEVAPFLGEEPSKDPAVLAMPQPYAHGTVKRCARLDVRKLIAMHRSRWLASGLLIEQRVDESDIHQLPDGVEVHGNTAPMLVHCKGPFSHSSGLVLVRGEGLTVRIPGLGLNTIVLAAGSGAGDETIPDGSPANLEIALGAFAAKMDLKEDVLILYTTSHGAPEVGLAYRDGDHGYGWIGPKRLADLLNGAGFSRRLVMLSACFSGELLPYLVNDSSVVVTAADRDQTSFGCAPGNDWTFFGDALINTALRTPQPFDTAIAQAFDLIRHWETSKRLQPSRPQFYTGSAANLWLQALEKRMPADATPKVGRPAVGGR